MKNAFAVVATCVLIAFASSEADTKDLCASDTPVSKIAPEIPVDWLRHVKDDLLPFWDQPSAYGDPIGNFPTYRCNDGCELENECCKLENERCKLENERCKLEGGKLCAAFSQLGKDDEWITSALHKDYVRMKSRQIFAYGVAFHMTGNPKYLILAKMGVEYLRTHALDPASGSMVSYWEHEEEICHEEESDDEKKKCREEKIRHPGPPQPQRTSQDLAYGLQGLAFYYYLTRDKTLLPDILRIKDHIMGHYYSAEWDSMRWVPKSALGRSSEEERKELVSLLDQVNAYMLLLAPILPEPFSSQWKRDLKDLCRIMREQFYSAEHNLFWGVIAPETERKIGGRHTDFGHSIKTFWMIYMVGKLTDDSEMKDFALTNGKRLLATAFHEKSGSWASRLKPDGSRDLDKEWWIYAELDQTAASFSLDDPSFYDKYLVKTYPWWIEHMVDRTNCGIWHKINYPGLTPQYPKVHLWKNGYHSFEHALIGYITDRIRDKKPVTLYYALSKEKQYRLQPYYYLGKNKYSTKLVRCGETVSLEGKHPIGFGIPCITRVKFGAP
ncbi:AGE family epimerase/isomerase [Candidatus Thiosymbion oneisti]|uniref:AGE family epimerase/isomerase n=1 Tax=Candidatus Thiosymbion oneisti TaxID=589554 RepID=UPI00105EEC0F|nr:AGE family epimerase/isomerase [Candidatus Thiosymbion oneisti]